MTERIYLMILSGVNPNTLTTGYHYFSTKGFTSAPTDTPASKYFVPRITNPGMYQQSMFSPGQTGGDSSSNQGFCELTNVDGILDNLIDWGFDGGVYQILEGPEDGDLTDFVTVNYGTIKQVESSWDTITIRYRDNGEFLDKPVILNYYLGDNVLPAGLEGASELKDKPKPRLFGSRRNITPICVNTSKLIYQYNDGASSSVGAVRDNGVALTVGVNHADSTAMLAATVAAGYYDTCLTEGFIRLGSSPTGLITMDAVSSTISIGQQYKALVEEKLAVGSVVEQSIIELDRLIPASIIWGYYTSTKIDTTKNVFDALSKAGIWWGFDNLGKFWAKQLIIPTSTNSITTLNVDNSVSIERTATSDSDKGMPVWKVTCNYNRNETVQTTVAGSVNASLYNSEWQTAIYSDVTIKTLHPLAEELIVDTPFNTYADALAEATRLFNLKSVRRDRLKINLLYGANGPLVYIKGGYWETEAISELPIDRYNHCSSVYQNYVYVIGGFISGDSTTSVIRLDLDNPTGAWDDTGVTDLPSKRMNAASVVYNNYLYVIGGTNGSAMSDVIRLDLSNPTGAWDNVGVTDLPVAKHSLAAVVHDNYLYTIGGTGFAYYDDVIRLDLDNPTGAWSSIGDVTSLPETRWLLCANINLDYLYVAGGFGPEGALTSAIRLDLNNPAGAWENLEDMPGIGRIGATSTICNDYLYVIGGWDGDAAYTNSVIRLDLSNPTGAWDDIGVTDMPDGRYRLSCNTYNKAIYSISGATATPKNNTWRLRSNENPEDYSQLNSLGRIINVKMPRYEYNAGKPMRMIGQEINHQTKEITLDLWG